MRREESARIGYDILPGAADSERSSRQYQSIRGTIKRLFVTDVTEDDERWLWTMVLPLLTEENMAQFEKAHPDPLTQRDLLFKSSAKEDEDATLFRKGMTLREYHDAVRTKLITLLAGPGMGFAMSTEISIDDDEVLLKIGFPDEKEDEHVGALARLFKWRTPLHPEAYRGGACPTSAYDRMKDDGEHHSDAFSGDDYFPLYIQYNQNHLESLQDFREIDKMRMVWRRLLDFMNLQDLEQQQVVVNFFPMHKLSWLNKLHLAGWCDMAQWYRLPSMSCLSIVRNYFGEEVAFFFHWFTFMTNMLAAPAALALIVVCVEYAMDSRTKQYITYSFVAFMLLWSTIFNQLYHQYANDAIDQWGMRGFEQVALPNANYDRRKRGTWRDLLQRVMHWILAIAFCAETVVVIVLISQWRSHALRHPHEKSLGFSNSVVANGAKYLITANIKIMAGIWSVLSPWLTDLENHGTKQDLKFAKVRKLFLVNLIVYFYPFLYIAFIKEHVEGCDNGPDGCLLELQNYLFFFYAFHILWVAIVVVLLPMLITMHKIRSELQSGAGTGKKYTYFQVQAKCEEYVGDTDDFMELAFVLGFVMMFSLILPSLAVIAFVSSMFEIRLLAWRMCFVEQRADPRGQEGIGVWNSVLDTLSKLSTVVNVAMVVFVMEPLRSQPPHIKLASFIVLEHVFIGVQLLVQACIPEVSFTLTRIREVNRIEESKLFATDNLPVSFEKQDCPKIGMRERVPREDSNC